LSELGIPAGERIETVYVEDIASSIERIERLPKEQIRGFSLHADPRGYYLIWPDRSYYKRRVYGAEAGNKYRGPSGHKKPPFNARVGTSESLILVEGEFNALSLASVECVLSDIVSPGGAGDFYSKRAEGALRECSQRYTSISLVVDADAAGAQAAIEAKSRLLVLGCPEVKIHLVEKDFNQLHCELGLTGLRDRVCEMGLL
jgi:hypothetical protein